jgi:hypothetical protein
MNRQWQSDCVSVYVYSPKLAVRMMDPRVRIR